MGQYKLYYFNVKGKAEVARQMLAYGNIPYEDIRYGDDEWPNYKPMSPFGKCPILNVNGKLISQSGAIHRFVAKQVGLYGKTDIECAEIDMILDSVDEMWQEFIPILYKETDKEKKEERLKCFKDVFLPEMLKNLEYYLHDNKKYFVGGRMTVADIRFATDIMWPTYKGVDFSLENYPKLLALVKAVNSDPKIAAWNAKRPVTPW